MSMKKLIVTLKLRRPSDATTVNSLFLVKAPSTSMRIDGLEECCWSKEKLNAKEMLAIGGIINCEEMKPKKIIVDGKNITVKISEENTVK